MLWLAMTHVVSCCVKCAVCVCLVEDEEEQNAPTYCTVVYSSAGSFVRHAFINHFVSFLWFFLSSIFLGSLNYFYCILLSWDESSFALIEISLGIPFGFNWIERQMARVTFKKNSIRGVKGTADNWKYSLTIFTSSGK